MSSIVNDRVALRTVTQVLVFAVLFGSAAAPAGAQFVAVRQPLSQAERARLDDGRLVVRAASEQRGGLRLVGGVSYQVIDAPVESVWSAMENVTRWRQMLPQVSESRQVSSSGAQRVVYLKQGAGPVQASYHLRASFAPARGEVTFVLDTSRDNDIRAAWGFMSVSRWGDGRTLVSYGAMVDFGAVLFSGMLRSTAQEWLLKVPLTIKQFMES